VQVTTIASHTDRQVASLVKRRGWAALCFVLLPCSCGGGKNTSDAMLASDRTSVDVVGIADAGAAKDGRAPDPEDARAAEDGGAPDQEDDEDGGTASEAGTTTEARPVRGIVIGSWGALAGRTVAIGAQSTVTSPSGLFTIDQAPSSYDVTILEPDGSLVSVYSGLTRRDPVLVHDAMYVSASNPTIETYQASISGILLGDFPFPVDSYHAATVSFFSSPGSSIWQLGLPLRSKGPSYGPMTAVWLGSPSVVGRLIALAEVLSETELWASAFLATTSLSLSHGATISQDLTLFPIATGQIAGFVQMYEGNSVSAVQFSYRLSDGEGMLDLGQFSSLGSYACVLPDLGSLGGDYCLSINDSLGTAQAERCGASLGMTDFSIQVQHPPVITNPTAGSPVTKDTKISWTGVAGAVYLVDLSPQSPTTPRLQLFTSQTQIRWPDLGAVGLPLVPRESYSCQVSGLLPYTSTDDFASSQGLFAVARDSSQKLRSSSITVTTVK
jgi:hypothetical protein